MMFGHAADAPCNEDESRRIIDAFLDAGNNFIDTANVYTGGQSEEVVGRAIKAKREQVVLATKGYGPIGSGPNDAGLGRQYLVRALDASLRRLDTDYIDVYQCHRADPDTPVEETMATLARVRAVGQGPLHRLLQLDRIADRGGAVGGGADRRHSVREPPAPLLADGARDRDGHPPRLPAPRPRHDGLQPARRRRPHREVPAGRGSPGRQPGQPQRHVVAACSTSRTSTSPKRWARSPPSSASRPPRCAIAWVLARRGVTSVIIGPRTFDQYEQNMEGVRPRARPGDGQAVERRVTRRPMTIHGGIRS